MSNTEDYLDGLLNSMEGKTNNNVEPESITDDVTFAEEPVLQEDTADDLELEPRGNDADADFLDSFEKEFLSGEDTDEFIRQFERELDSEMGETSAEEDSVQKLFDNTENLTEPEETEGMFPEDVASEEVMSEEAVSDDMDMDFMVDTLGEIPGDDIEIPADFSDSDGEFSFSSDFDEPLPGLSDEETTSEEVADTLTDDNQDLMDLLQSEGDFSELGDMLNTEEQVPETDDFFAGLDGFTLEEVPIDDTMVLEDAEEEADGKNGKETSGFLKKLSQVLFGEEEEEQEVAAAPVKAAPEVTKNIEDMSDENLMLLQELEGTGAAPAEEEQEAPETEEEAKARKKREKEEKKAKKKAERAEKKAQAKAAKAEKQAKKEKKPKKPKEPDNTPPLPRKPVMLCFVMAGSFLALVLLGTNLFGYSASMANAEKQFGLGNYEEAFQKVSGLEIKDQDDAAYQKYRVMGMVAGEYGAYQTFMEAGIYDMALDSLVRAVGRCQKYEADATLYGCAGELAKINEQASGALGSFGITSERALELYAIEEKSDYSAQILTILEDAGYTIEID